MSITSQSKAMLPNVQTCTHTQTHIHTHIYVCVCVCSNIWQNCSTWLFIDIYDTNSLSLTSIQLSLYSTWSLLRWNTLILIKVLSLIIGIILQGCFNLSQCLSPPFSRALIFYSTLSQFLNFSHFLRRYLHLIFLFSHILNIYYTNTLFYMLSLS
jgi:hypothetical protein